MNRGLVFFRTNRAKQNNALAVLLLSILVGILSSVLFENQSILACTVLGAIPVFLIIRRESINLVKELLLYYIVAVSFVFLVYYGNIHLYGFPYYYGGSDDTLFEQMGYMFISKNYAWPWDYHYSSNVKGMYCLMSYIIRFSNMLGGYHTISFRLININLYLSVALVTHLIFDQYFASNTKVSRRVFLLIALFPNGIYLSSYVFRDTIVALIIMLALALCDDILNNGDIFLLIENKTVAVIFLIFLTFFGAFIRLELVFYVLVIFLLSFLHNNELAGKKVYSILILAFFMIFVISRLGFVEYASEKITRYQDFRSSLASDDSNQIYQAVFKTAMFPFGLFLRVAFGLYSPLPTALLKFYKALDNEINFLQILIAVGTCWQAIHLPFLFKNIRKMDKYTLCFLFIFISVIISTFTIRHFIMFYPLMILLICRARFAVDSSSRIRNLFLGSGILVLFGAVYLFI